MRCKKYKTADSIQKGEYDLKKVSVKIIALCIILCSAAVNQQLYAQLNTSYQEITYIRSAIDKIRGSLSNSAWDKSLADSQYMSVMYPDVADFVYMQNLALLGAKKSYAQVLPVLTQAISMPRWLQYSKNEARVLLADILTDTTENIQSLAVLNDSPRLDSADAEYIRAKASYRLGKSSDAGTIIHNALSIFPFDVRFPLLFLQTQWLSKQDNNSAILAQLIISRISVWKNENPEILLYAVPFATDKTIRTRFLQEYRETVKIPQPDKTYSAPASEKVLSALFALQNDIISDSEAFGEIIQADEIPFQLLSEFIPFVKSAETKKLIETSLASFGGVLTWDTNTDGIVDMSSQYDSGRPVSVLYDKNQDGTYECTMRCDFGVPQSVFVTVSGSVSGTAETFDMQYGQYPFVKNIDKVDVSGNKTHYVMIPFSLQWSPITVQKALFAYMPNDFFIPGIAKKTEKLTEGLIAVSTLYLEKESIERQGAFVRIHLRGAQPYSAQYILPNGIEYAYMVYENSIPKMRHIDSDLNGIFESSEFYEKNPVSGEIYIVRFILDSDEDGYAEYTEQFFPLPANIEDAQNVVIKTAIWNFDADTTWDIYYEKRANGYEVSSYVHPHTKDIITLKMQNSKPIAVSAKGMNIPVYPDIKKNFYWINEISHKESNFSEKVMHEYNLQAVNGVSYLVTIDNTEVLVILVGDVYFGEILND